MRISRSIFSGFFFTSALLVATAISIGEEGLLLEDLSGKKVNPLSVGEKKAVVLFFISPYCPTSNTFAPAMKEIEVEFSKDFLFYSVHSDPAVTAKDREAHREMMKIDHPVLDDSAQALARKLGAKITPEVVVVGEDGGTLYQGRINDLYLGPTSRQQEATKHDLKEALEAILAGREVPVAKTEAVGCEIGGL
ncbi:MAG: thioredoxin-like domain-containing protein [Verrucomicrobiota bacterium]